MNEISNDILTVETLGVSPKRSGVESLQHEVMRNIDRTMQYPILTPEVLKKLKEQAAVKAEEARRAKQKAEHHKSPGQKEYKKAQRRGLI